MPVQNNLLSLMGAKQARESRKINVTVVADETGLNRYSLYRWLANDITRFDSVFVETLCEYFGVQVGDLLYIADEPQGA